MDEGTLEFVTGSDDRVSSTVAATPGISVGLLPVAGTIRPTSIRPLRVLGHGRAAEARLVCATDESGAAVLCVEKVFHPGWLTRLIYRASFQSPFAYQYNADAIQASFYRRRAAAAIVEAMIPEAKVAQPLYVRWDQETRALVLASEYIRGRGIIPQAVDPQMVRRWLASRFGIAEQRSPVPAEEMQGLLDLMARLETLLLKCGLTGSGWQVCKRAMVSTANLLRTESGYVVVDLESGIPSVLVPLYVIQGLRLQSLPLFDDLDAKQLQNWLEENQGLLATSLGDGKHRQLKGDVASLILHSDNWKRSEPAIGRQPWRLLTSDFFARFRSQVLERWQRCGILDQESASQLRNGSRFLTTMTFMLGLIPGRAGRFSQKLWGNSAYRQHVQRWCADSHFRSHKLSEFAEQKSAEWKSNDRIASDCTFKQFNAGFMVNWLLSILTSAALQRWLVDRTHRRNQQTRMFLFCVSGRFQSEYGRLLIRSRIEHWRKNSRLTEQDADGLNQQLASSAVDEYVRGFGLHVGLKLLLPLVMPLKVGGAAASLASGNPFYFLFMLMLVPILRTGITLWRLMASRRSLSDFRHALLVGILPVVGSIAYPVQMYARFSGLSMFLMRDFASRVGCWLPIYGGKDSRVELMSIKSVNVVAEAFDLWISATGSVTTTGRTLAAPLQDDSGRFIRIGRWDRLVSEQLSLLKQSELNPRNLGVEDTQEQAGLTVTSLKALGARQNRSA